MADVSRRLGVSTHSLYKWIKLQQIPAGQRLEQASQSEEMRHLKAELKRVRGGTPAVVAPNLLSQQFTVNAPNRLTSPVPARMRGLYLATVIDLFSRQVMGWATENRIDTLLPLDALYTVIWRRRPREAIPVHSDQGCQCTNREWQRFLASRNLPPSMSRRGNCHDYAIAESFFRLLKRERIRKHIYATRQETRSDVFSYIEMFYNTIRRHSSVDGLSPVGYERQYSVRLAPAQETLVDSLYNPK